MLFARSAPLLPPLQRKQLSEQLEDLLSVLLKRRLLRGRPRVIEARVPIIKCLLELGGKGRGASEASGAGAAAALPPLPVDISLGADNGAAAVDFVRRQVLGVAPLRPLCLAVKAFLRERGHNEVFTGGLGSYAVVNMVRCAVRAEPCRAVLGWARAVPPFAMLLLLLCAAVAAAELRLPARTLIPVSIPCAR